MAQDLLRAITSNLPGIIFTLDLNGVFTFSDGKSLSKRGPQPEQVLGASVYEVYQNYPEFLDCIRRALKGDLSFAVLPIGDFFYETRYSALQDEQGKTTGLLCIATDVTEGKKDEQVLREREERKHAEAYLRALFDKSADAILLLENGAFTDCNEATVEMMHASNKEQFLALHPSRLSPEFQPDGRPSGEKADEMIRIALEKGSHRFEWIHRRVDGVDFPVEVLLTPMTLLGRTTIHTVWRDISERKQIEATLRASEERFRGIYENSTIGMYRTTREGKILFANPALLRMLGYETFEELAERNLETEGYEAGYERQEYRRRVEDGTLRGYESAWTRKDGTTVFINESASAARDAQGNVLYYEGTVEDITDRKKLENEIQESFKRRGHQVEVAREVAQRISTAPDLEAIFPLVVTLIKERFDYYHAQIFRYDPAEDAIVLVSGYGEAGQKMLASGHKLVMGHGVVGAAAQTGEAILAADTSKDPGWKPNPLLPNTHGELAVPIKFREEILGILDVQSEIADHLTQEDVLLLENLAGQIAIAIENTRVLDEVNIFRQGIEQADQAVFVTKPNGTITYVNAAFEQVYGYTAEEALGKTPRIIKSGLIPTEQYQYFWASLLNKETVGGEITNKRKDGRLVYIEGSNNPILNRRGEVVAFLAIHRDITERKKTEMETQETVRELERLNRVVSQGGWETYANENQATNAYVYDNLQIEEKAVWETEIATALEKKTTLRSGHGTQTVVSPLTIRGESIGALGISGTLDLDDEDVALLESISEQVALALESARLFNQTQVSEANFRNLIENAPEAILVIDTTTGLFTEPNENAVRLFGLSREELVKVGPAQTSHEFQPDGRLSSEAMADKINQTLEGGSPVFEWLLTNAEEQLVPCEIHLSRLPGDRPLVRATLVDITERKKAQDAIQQNEEALRRQNEYLATAAEVSRLVTSTLDLETLFVRTVDLIKSRFGYYFVSIFTVDDLGMNAVLREGTGLVGGEMKSRKHSLSVGSRSIIGSVTSTGTTMVANDTTNHPIHRPNPLLPETRAEVGIPLKIGSRIIGALDIQAHVVHAFYPDDIAILETLADQIAVALDNANSYDLAQKAVTEMRELDRIKSQFLANMSHELRTPLNSIIGFSRVILKGIDGPITEQQNQDLSAIYSSGQHLLGLINDILDSSKIEAGKMELSVEEINISDTINSVLTTAVGLLKDKPVKLRSEVDPSTPTVRADPMRIRQILLNFISNAVKFTDEGSVTISTRVQVGKNEIHELVVSVIDTGPGISPEDQKKLFQAFSQVDSSPTRATGGTGLGLSIAQRMIELHGGHVGVKSAVGQGSTFFFTLPLFHQPKAERSVGEGRTILCIDDDPQVIGLYERYLHPQGFKVIPVSTAINARDTAKRIKPYAITLDIMMPEVDGWTVLEQLKSDPETRNIPVIICSIVEEEEKGFSLGAADYLVKPILEEDLVIALNRLNGDGAIQEVLIIDDSLDDLRLMEKILTEHSSFHPTLAEGGEQGWKILTEKTPDAVILDLFMPDVDGFTILERLRTTPELRDIPVVVVSGMDLTPGQKEKLENLGKHMLQKGMLNEKELFATLEKALKRLESK